MTGFLDHLAGMAVGASPPGAAHLSVPPRFAPAAPASVEAEPRPEPLGTGRAVAFPAPRSAAQPPTRDPAPSIPAFRAAPDRPEVPAPAPTATHRPSPARPAPVFLIEPRSAEPPAAALGPPPGIVTPEFPAKAQPYADLPEHRSRAAPLDPHVLAGRMVAPSQPRPVIHVTIDRIDVRAPAPSRPVVTPRRARTAASVSLADYLHQGGKPASG